MMNARGFTLIELILVLVLIGIIAAFAMPRLGDVTSSNASAFADKLKADIRAAANTAMTKNQRSRVYFNGSGTAPVAGYSVVLSTSAACSGFIALIDPATNAAWVVALNTGTYGGTTVSPSMACLEYDSLGRPYDCSGLGNVCSNAPAGMTVTVQGNGTAAGMVTVSARTGAVN